MRCSGLQTREHHDLDVLVLGEDLPALAEVFRDHGFDIQQVWEAENRWLDVDGITWPTAFAAATGAGAELDVHVIELRAGVVVPLCNVPWPFDAGALEGLGAISDRPVGCVSAQTQVAMHRGYELPESQQHDVDLLQQLL
jgi:lincosamide nucleotidyltransferase A/C/D/E